MNDKSPSITKCPKYLKWIHIMKIIYAIIYVYKYICMYVCMYVCICMYVYMYVYTCVCYIAVLDCRIVIAVSNLGLTDPYKQNNCMYVCMYVCMYGWMDVYT